MTVLRLHSMGNSLDEGSTDGKYRKRRPDTTVMPGDGDGLVFRERAGLGGFYSYGLINQEAGDKVNPGKM